MNKKSSEPTSDKMNKSIEINELQEQISSIKQTIEQISNELRNNNQNVENIKSTNDKIENEINKQNEEIILLKKSNKCIKYELKKHLEDSITKETNMTERSLPIDDISKDENHEQITQLETTLISIQKEQTQLQEQKPTQRFLITF